MKHALLLLVCLLGSLTPAPAVEASKVLQPGRYSGLVVLSVTDPIYKSKRSISAKFTARLNGSGLFDGYFITSPAGDRIAFDTFQASREIFAHDKVPAVLSHIQDSDSTRFTNGAFDPNSANNTGLQGLFSDKTNGRRSNCKLTSKALSFEDAFDFGTGNLALPGTATISVKLVWVGL